MQVPAGEAKAAQACADPATRQDPPAMPGNEPAADAQSRLVPPPRRGNKRARPSLPALPPVPPILVASGGSAPFSLAVAEPLIVSMGRGRPRKPPGPGEAESDPRFQYLLGRTFKRRALRNNVIVTFTGTVRDVQYKKKVKGPDVVTDMDVWCHVEWDDGDKEDMSLAELKDWEERDRAICAIEQHARSRATSEGLVVIPGRPLSEQGSDTEDAGKDESEKEEQVACASERVSEAKHAERKTRAPRRLPASKPPEPPKSTAPKRRRAAPASDDGGKTSSSQSSQEDADDASEEPPKAPRRRRISVAPKPPRPVVVESEEEGEKSAEEEEEAKNASITTTTAGSRRPRRRVKSPEDEVVPEAASEDEEAPAVSDRASMVSSASESDSSASVGRSKRAAPAKKTQRRPLTGTTTARKRAPSGGAPKRHAFRAVRSSNAKESTSAISRGEEVPGAIGRRGDFPTMLDLIREGKLAPGEEVLQVSYAKNSILVDLTADGLLIWQDKKYADPLMMLNDYKQQFTPNREKAYRDWRSIKYVGSADPGQHRSIAALREELKLAFLDKPLVRIVQATQERDVFERVDARSREATAVASRRKDIVQNLDPEGDVDSSVQQPPPSCVVCASAQAPLLSCATCNLVTHAHCAQPPMPAMPAASTWFCWRCVRPVDPLVRDLMISDEAILKLPEVPQTLSLAGPPVPVPSAWFATASSVLLPGSLLEHYSAKWVSAPAPSLAPFIRAGVFRAPSSSHPSCWVRDVEDDDPLVTDVLPSSEVELKALAPGIPLLDAKDRANASTVEAELRLARAGWLGFVGGPISSLSFAPSEPKCLADRHVALLAAGSGNTVQLWTCAEASGLRFACGIVFPHVVSSCSFAPMCTPHAWVLSVCLAGGGGIRVLLVPREAPLHLWVDANKLECFAHLQVQPMVQVWKPDSLLLAVACSDHCVRVWDMDLVLHKGFKSAAPLREIRTANVVSDLCFCAEDSDLLALCDEKSGVSVYEDQLLVMSLPDAGLSTLVWPRGADYFVAGNKQGDVVLLQIVDGSRLVVLAHTARVNKVIACDRLHPPVVMSSGDDGLALTYRLHAVYAHDLLGKRAPSRLGKPGTLLCSVASMVRLAGGRIEPLLAASSRLNPLTQSTNAVVGSWAATRRPKGHSLVSLTCCAMGYGGVDTLDAKERNIELLQWPLALDFKADLLPGYQVSPEHGPVRHYEWVAVAGPSGVLKVSRGSVDCDVN